MGLETRLLMGNEAIALGAVRAGVRVVTGYPGTPSTEILETVAKQRDERIYVEWSTNEKSALEVAAGAAYAGARVMVTMKQVGLNVASDPLMSLNYVGVKGGMVIVVADDPGPISSQTEQDTRHFGVFAKLMVFDPSTPEEAYLMIAEAFAYSEKYSRPVLFRPTTRVCHSYASVTLLPELPAKEPEGFSKDNGRFVIFPRLTFQNHKIIEGQLVKLRDDFSSYERNQLSGGGKKGIATGGVSYAYVRESLAEIEEPYKLLKISTVPFPEKLALEFLDELDEVLVIEELDPVIERELILLCGKKHISLTIKGKTSGHVQNAGENTVQSVREALYDFFKKELPALPVPEPPALPVRPPVLCAGCPHRGAFFAVKEAAKGKKAVYSGDIGCYTLGNALPLDMVDTCLCMGAGITVAQGINRVEPDTLNFAFIGDSTFFHTGLPGVVNAVYNEANIIICILDNYTTAMTGNQPHPGMGVTAAGAAVRKISIYDVVKAIGVSEIVRVNPFDLPGSIEAVKGVLSKKGVRVLLFEGPCIAVAKGSVPHEINEEKCTGCKVCVRKIGCPAMYMENGKCVIDPVLCTGCGVCVSLCRFHAIERGRG
ncbi:MAG: indolepyruvate ferredoxin oxidoreductase subunit alpha [Oscillospiraceae bacterium]|jgi:indolepyruvate ferredoxin oxidoreductase alpha subunit|nr:indolepyruvate ferredoxin oxidoreductase subunit alpha [Oscillospiraceae bacterium]